MFLYGGIHFQFDPFQRHQRKKNVTAHKNLREFNNWFSQLTNLYLNIFEWTGMPDTVNLRYLEITLFTDGKILFFEDKKMGYMALACAGESKQNVYWEYLRYRTQGNGYYESYNEEDCVLIRENEMQYPPFFWIDTMAAKIADSGCAIDVFANSMKRPWLVTHEKDDTVTFQTLIDDVNNNEIAVFGAERLAMAEVNVFPNNQDSRGLVALWDNKHELMDEVYTFMGVNNANTDKKERLITDEVEANNQAIFLNIMTGLDLRKRACEEINKKFGLNVSVKLRHVEAFKPLEDHKEVGEGEGENGTNNNGVTDDN